MSYCGREEEGKGTMGMKKWVKREPTRWHWCGGFNSSILSVSPLPLLPFSPALSCDPLPLAPLSSLSLLSSFYLPPLLLSPSFSMMVPVIQLGFEHGELEGFPESEVDSRDPRSAYPRTVFVHSPAALATPPHLFLLTNRWRRLELASVFLAT